MRRGVIGLLVLFSFSLLPAYSATPPKVGAACSKQGISKTYQGKKFTCIKSGKKLVWNKGIVVKKSIPTPTPSPTPTPTPTPAPIATPTPTSTATPIPTPNTSSDTNRLSVGLLEQSYDGYFADNIDFFRQDSNKSSSVNRIDLREQYDGKKEFSKQWSGFFIPDLTGTWKFTITSDDSSHFWLGASAASLSSLSKTIFGLPGIHAPMTRSQSLYLNKGNAYPIRLIWGNSINFAQMTLDFTDPNGILRKDSEKLLGHLSPKNQLDDGVEIRSTLSYLGSLLQVSLEPFRSAPRDSTALIIQRIIDEANLKGKPFDGKVVWYFEGETSSEVESSTKKILGNGIQLFSRLGFATTDALVLNGRTSTWLKNQLRTLGCSFGDLYDSPGGYYLPSKACQGGHGAVTAPHWEWVKINERKDDIEGIHFSHVLPHEYFHQIQEELAMGVGNGPYPLWFWEGGAHFFTLLAYANWNTERFYEQWSDYWFVEKEDPLKSGCVGVNVFYMNNSENGDKRFCGYSKGSIVAEFLVSKVGIAGYQKLIAEQAKNPNVSFSQVFEQVVGIKIEEFYSETDKFLRSRGWN